MNEQNSPTPNKQSSLDPKVVALLSYLLWLIGGIVFFATSRDPFVRFHAMQSVLFNAAIAVIYVFMMILGFMFWYLLGIISLIIWTAIFALWIILMVKAYQGEKFKLPIIGPLAERIAK